MLASTPSEDVDSIASDEEEDDDEEEDGEEGSCSECSENGKKGNIHPDRLKGESTEERKVGHGKPQSKWQQDKKLKCLKHGAMLMASSCCVTCLI